MRSLKEFKRLLSSKGNKIIYDNADGKVLLNEVLNKLEWLQLISEDINDIRSKYQYNSNLGTFQLDVYKDITFSLRASFFFTANGTFTSFAKNEVFKMSDVVNRDLPKILQAKIIMAINEKRYLLYGDAKTYIWHLHLKSEVDYYQWWESYKPLFLPKNPAEYYNSHE